MKLNPELKLKSLLAAPKLKSGAKAFALALSFAVFPFWLSSIAFLAVYLSPFVFPVPFLLSGISVLYALRLITSMFGEYWAFFLGLDLFFVLLVVKDYAVSDREKVFSMLSAATFLVVIFGYFSAVVPLLVLFLVSLALSADLLSFSPERLKHYSLSALVALVAVEFAWLFNTLNFSPYFSTALVFAIVSSLVFALTRHLKGTLIGTNALFFSLAVPITAIISIFIALLS